MPAAEYLNALGRLLRDGGLRDAFAQNPMSVAQTLGLASADSAALLQLDAEELENQAQVLLRKRFESVKEHLPETFGRFGSDAWNEFQNYARIHWPTKEMDARTDALEFFQVSEEARKRCPEEFKRLLFVSSCKRVGASLTWRLEAGWIRVPILQCFLRRKSDGIREWRCSLRF